MVGLRGSFLEQGGLKETQGQVTDSYMENTAYETDLGKKDKMSLLSAASVASHLKPFIQVAHEFAGSSVLALYGEERRGGGWEPALLPNAGHSYVSVPTEDPSGESLIISPEEFERIKWASQVLTKEELNAREQALKKEKEGILVTHLPSCVLGGRVAE